MQKRHGAYFVSGGKTDVSNNGVMSVHLMYSIEFNSVQEFNCIYLNSVQFNLTHTADATELRTVLHWSHCRTVATFISNTHTKMMFTLLFTLLWNKTVMLSNWFLKKRKHIKRWKDAKLLSSYENWSDRKCHLCTHHPGAEYLCLPIRSQSQVSDIKKVISCMFF